MDGQFFRMALFICENLDYTQIYDVYEDVLLFYFLFWIPVPPAPIYNCFGDHIWHLIIYLWSQSDPYQSHSVVTLGVYIRVNQNGRQERQNGQINCTDIKWKS